MFSAPGGGGGGPSAQLPVATTPPAVAMSWCVKFDRISRSVVGLSAPLSGLKGLTLWSSENATLAKRCGSKATWKRRSEEHTSELQSQSNLVCRLLLENNTRWTGPDCCVTLTAPQGAPAP